MTIAQHDSGPPLRDFVAFRREHLGGDGQGEAQTFLDRRFKAFGHPGVIEAGSKFEKRLRKSRSADDFLR